MNQPRLDQTQTPLLSALQACADRTYAPFHTPGHKRGQGMGRSLLDLLGVQASRADLPELPELDNLFAPQGVIQAAQTLAAEAFGADQTWFLVNGSTSGVIAMILATCDPGDKIILPRNVHQSAISGLILSGAVPIFVQPEYDPEWDLAHGVTPTTIAAALAQHPDAKAVFVVYPTYYGTCSDLATISEITHHANIPLLVDEAHGAHFAFHPDFPTPALVANADLTVQSTHKTLSALTQAAMLHQRGGRVDGDRISRALQLVQSTSPNYLLLASLDAARQQMATVGKDVMARTLQLADQARSRLSQIPGLRLLQPEQATTPGFCMLDRTRLTVNVAGLGIDGFTADEILHQQLGVTCELPTLRHLTFIVSLGNTAADIERLVVGFQQLAEMGSREDEEGEGDGGDGGCLLYTS
ncbi:aminotransferase class I/II-fold pyridoxal phosphate-dependent enzyme, partial [Pantanalinema rosaneae CENA516]|uniref:aminotransferase class I/II-fold pyridoxal phosphate-dependent enzyme n=1 Tax=Pantanalinema rosaneae TaxID=1620701 RepID=UPI003D6F4670